MRQKIMTHVTVLVVLTVLLTYLAASLVMYHKYRGDMEADVIKEAEYIRYALENVGEEYLEKDLGQLTTSRITVIDSQGKAVYDSNPEEDQEDLQELQEFQNAREEGEGQSLGFRICFPVRPFIMQLGWMMEIFSGWERPQTVFFRPWFPALPFWESL